MALPAVKDPRTLASRAALLGVLVLSGLLEFVRLSQNGYANIYYSAAVKSMLRSWQNFFFVASGPQGLVTVDKPPLGLWLQALSAKVFGFSPLSLLIPEGICAVLAVALMYRIIAPRFGRVAGLASAFALAVFPSFVAVSRDNALDPLLILLALAACAAALRAIDSGRFAPLALSAVLVGLAFNTKALAAVLVVPGIALAYLYCAPATVRARLGKLVLAGVVMVLVGGSWTAAVELTPASARPFIGSTSSNSELGLDFGYNGFGRVGGQQGGPSSTKIYPADKQPPLIRPGLTGNAPESAVEKQWFATHHGPQPGPPARRSPVTTGRQRGEPVAFASDTLSPVRIFGIGLGDQAGWVVPLAVIAALALLPLLRRRRDPRTGVLLALGGWFAIELERSTSRADRSPLLLLGARSRACRRARRRRRADRGDAPQRAAADGARRLRADRRGDRLHGRDPALPDPPLRRSAVVAHPARGRVRRRAARDPARTGTTDLALAVAVAPCSWLRWSTASACGSRRCRGRSRLPGPTTTPATAVSASRRTPCSATAR